MKSRVIFLSLVVTILYTVSNAAVLTTKLGSASAALEASPLVEIQDRNYLFSDGVLATQSEALTMCLEINQMKMTLATFETQEENANVIAFLQNNPTADELRWTSGHRDLNTWTWYVDDWTIMPISYFYWAAQQPNESQDSPACLSITSHGWDDQQCQEKLPFICEEIV